VACGPGIGKRADVTEPGRVKRLAIAALALLCLLAISGSRPYDRLTWLMEVAPILMVGGAYSYARVPLGQEFAQLFGLQRNPYDKLGHFFQGFVPALVAREVLLRGKYVRRGKMLGFLAVCIALAISAAYELVEWGAALALGQGADEFLGTQGDPWDTQSDMFAALIGAIIAVALLSRLQDRQILELEGRADAQA
jgi:putative membrane protein